MRGPFSEEEAREGPRIMREEREDIVMRAVRSFQEMDFEESLLVRGELKYELVYALEY